MPRGLQLLPGKAVAMSPGAPTGFRLRPTERPVWIDLAASTAEARKWVQQAASAGLSVDVWAAVKLEWELVLADVPIARVRVLVDYASREASAARLAPSEELRRWLEFLGRGRQSSAEHDLPSVALPARVVARIAPTLLKSFVVDAANAPLDPNALIVERAASLNGMTMESWVYRALALGS
jgi:hypothetical protein